MTSTVWNSKLQEEIDEISRAPLDAIGLGEKSYLPYEVVLGPQLIRHPAPEVTQRLGEAVCNPMASRTFRLVLLHILALRDDPAVDAVLVSQLGTPELRATSAYLLGRIGYKGYPKRQRDIIALLDALRSHLDDTTLFQDPWLGKLYVTQDLVIAAFVRLAGPERFHLDPESSDHIGYTLARFTPAERESLLKQCKHLKISKKEPN